MTPAKHSFNFSAQTQLSAIDLQHLRFAVAAADHGSFRQAAGAMAVRQSTLSRSIMHFEQLIGVSLFERSSGGVTPTLAGRNVLRLARTILGEFEALIATAKSTRSGESGRLAIGFCTSLTAGNLRSSLLEFKQKAPRIELVIVERSQTQLATALRNGVLDVLVVTGSAPIVGGNTLALWSERILAVLHEDHPLTSREVVHWTDLRSETVLLSQCDPGREIEELLLSKLIRPEGRPRIERHDISHGVIKSLVMMKLGISLVLESDIGTNFSGLVYRELRDGAGPSRLDYSAYWRADNENPVLESFLKLLSSRYPSTSLAR
jgi:DNA-binding transcriptional LysR family regulator